jgi:YesN/AraC family two-component response regulator
MDTEFLLKSIKIKVENYLVKPVNMKELLNSIHDTLLPLTQDKEIKKSYNIIKSISMICDNKHIEVIRFIINNLDNNNIFNYSYQEIMEKIDISKPTLVKLFRILIEKGILTKLQRSKYLFNEDRLNHINMERKK